MATAASKTRKPNPNSSRRKAQPPDDLFKEQQRQRQKHLRQDTKQLIGLLGSALEPPLEIGTTTVKKILETAYDQLKYCIRRIKELHIEREFTLPTVASPSPDLVSIAQSPTVIQKSPIPINDLEQYLFSDLPQAQTSPVLSPPPAQQQQQEIDLFFGSINPRNEISSPSFNSVSLNLLEPMELENSQTFLPPTSPTSVVVSSPSPQPYGASSSDSALTWSSTSSPTFGHPYSSLPALALGPPPRGRAPAPTSGSPGIRYSAPGSGPPAPRGAPPPPTSGPPPGSAPPPRAPASYSSPSLASTHFEPFTAQIPKTTAKPEVSTNARYPTQPAKSAGAPSQAKTPTPSAAALKSLPVSTPAPTTSIKKEEMRSTLGALSSPPPPPMASGFLTGKPQLPSPRSFADKPTNPQLASSSVFDAGSVTSERARDQDRMSLESNMRARQSRVGQSFPSRNESASYEGYSGYAGGSKSSGGGYFGGDGRGGRGGYAKEVESDKRKSRITLLEDGDDTKKKRSLSRESEKKLKKKAETSTSTSTSTSSLSSLLSLSIRTQSITVDSLSKRLRANSVEDWDDSMTETESSSRVDVEADDEMTLEEGEDFSDDDYDDDDDDDTIFESDDDYIIHLLSKQTL